MKYLLLIIIKLYWKYIPESKRRKCLFKTSCSNYVYKITKEKGLISGFRAMIFRINNCNSNHNIIEVDKKKLLITNTHKVFNECEINQYFLK
ncbi:membrane protein insertion efficiency factor YidD [Flavivirga aquimarina]|uniref:membrane protein insertion efficiency factor YidD n=1 Tax=Flavivirga aquimarina TaxID=2027862 RepID=UPI00349ED130